MKVIGAAVSLIVLLLLAAGGTLMWLRGSLPQTRGRLHVAGLLDSVTVSRDAYAVPRISAANEHDAYFALGFVHAQDRLWQMEMQRRAGAGRLAELFGTTALPTDRFMRTLGVYRLAQTSLERLEPPVRAALEAYAEGVNAWMAGRTGPLPPEFVFLGHVPEPWVPADSLVWGRLMAMQLSGDWREELLRAQVAARLPLERLRTLWPASPADAATTALDETTAGALIAAMPDIVQPRLASNVWVVSGEYSATGKPLLANDPHLAFEAPILWYLAAIEAPGLRITGATVPGVPFHLLGHNERIAWGITTTHSDTMDVFVERPNGDGYDTPDGPRPFTARQETITIRDGAPVLMTVRGTRHGPLVSDVLGDKAEGRLLALSATALDPADVTPQAFYKLNRATDWPTFVAALRDFGTPQQNVAYADTAGHIGLCVPGRVPIRRDGNGTLPRPGWTGEYDWVGWVPFDELPRLYDPPSGRIVNANNKVVPDGYPYLLAADWPEPYRARRIEQLLNAAKHHTVEYFSRIQNDTVSLMERDLMAGLSRVRPPTSRSAKALDMLRGWSGNMDRGRPEPLIMAAWLIEFQRHLLVEALGDLGKSFAVPRPLFLRAALAGDGGWCAEGCGDRLASSLDRAVEKLAARYGDDPNGWRWADAHRATFEHRLFRHLPAIRQIARLSIPTGGGDFTVNRGSYLPSEESDEPFAHLYGPGYRAVYDLSDLAAGSRYVIATGQSGNPLSPHYRDLLHLWRDGAYIRLPPERPTDLLTLDPAPL